MSLPGWKLKRSIYVGILQALGIDSAEVSKLAGGLAFPAQDRLECLRRGCSQASDAAVNVGVGSNTVCR